MDMNPDFNKIVYFLKVSEKKNFSEAARELYISPQALNKQITLLEKELGEKLFHRTTRSMQLTEFGRFFCNQMLPVHQLYKMAVRDIEYYLNNEERILKIIFFQGMSKRHIVLPIMNELMVLLPDTQMELGAVEMDQAFEEVRSGKADLAITYAHEYEDAGDLGQIPIMKVPAAIVISYYHPWMVKEKITKEDMAAMPVLYLKRDKGPDTRGFYNDLKASAYHFTSTYNSMLAKLEAGKEYGVFPAMFENLEGDGFRAIELPETYAFDYTISVFYRKDNKFSDIITSLDFLADEIQEIWNKKKLI